jgi:hypothetical protein
VRWASSPQGTLAYSTSIWRTQIPRTLSDREASCFTWAVVEMIDETVELILERRGAVPKAQSLLVALSGIDASGKGFLAGPLHTALERRGVRPS